MTLKKIAGNICFWLGDRIFAHTWDWGIWWLNRPYHWCMQGSLRWTPEEWEEVWVCNNRFAKEIVAAAKELNDPNMCEEYNSVDEFLDSLVEDGDKEKDD
jgi:hypothetical protein